MSIAARFRLERQDFALEVDLIWPDRGVAAVVGPSGCGKTTFLRCLAGLERPAGGFLQVRDEVWQDDSRRLFVPTHRRAVGYVFQEPTVFPHLDVRGNLDFAVRLVPVGERRVSLEEATALLGLSHLLHRRSDGLSGGERQRVAIARALVSSPRLLLMDEPLSALDSASKAEILPYLERLHDELSIPVVYVTHATAEAARMADYLVLMERGRVRDHGPLAELVSRLDAFLIDESDVEAVLSVTVAGHDEDFQLTRLEFPQGVLHVPRRELAVGRQARVLLRARDVSLALVPPEKTSISNILRARVVSLSPRGPAEVLVRLDVAGATVWSLVTRHSAHVLGLASGLALYAQIKAVSVL
ncbi:MAG: molybdenum ABC transporter ATP-binding protein [Candidatus Riflebacteria bacterium]|nr:molybdenum ABC transporter ATP-binding protein [Candidatus Riflebacteria bacterium]